MKNKLFQIFFQTLVFYFLVTSPVLAEEVTLKVGFSLPLTGQLAHVGEDIKRGVELGLEGEPKTKIGFQVIYDDNQHDPKQAVTSARKMLLIDKVDVIVSVWDMADVIAPIAEKTHTPHISIRWDPDIVKKYEYTMTFETTFKSYVDSQIKLLHSLGAHTVGLLSGENQGWVLAQEYFLKVAKQTHIRIVADEVFSTEEYDHRSMISRVLAKSPDFVVVFANPPHSEILVRRIREQAPQQQITGYFETVEKPEYIEGIPFVVQFEAAGWFQNQFKNHYGAEFQSRAPQGYDIILLLRTAYADYNTKLPPKALISELSHIQNLHGASGVLNANNTKNFENVPVWRIVRGQKLEEFNPSLGSEDD